ncbi:MAG: bifunctional metallophosphatase/5'-nucleotidase [Armatimonadetes bacterium]|nr:bifunctional metallophosphatase/5'-nucleotidase [Armatimonadota bacterium]
MRRATLHLLLVWLAFFLLFSNAWCQPEYRLVTILHTNDIHDHLIPFSYPDALKSSAPVAEMMATKNIGGLARVATLANQIEASVRGNAILVDAGDICDGTPFGIEYKGEADFAALSAAGYDVMVTGNHEFGQSLEQFNRNLALAEFPIVCANLLKKDSLEPALPEYVIYDFNGVRIAFLGLTTPQIVDYKAVKEGFAVKDPYETAKHLVPKLKNKADIVVVLSHLGEAEDEKLARMVPEIDVIVGGHSHTRLATPKIIKHNKPAEAFSLGGTVIVQAYQWAGELGRLDLRLRRNSGPFTLMSVDGKLIPVTSDIPEDHRTAEVIRRYYIPISKRYDKIIGEATADMVDKGGGGPVLNLVCDAIREETGAQISIYGVGGVRGNFAKGPIKVWDVATVLPFHNKLVLMELTGAHLKQIIERFPISPGVSGMRYKIVNRKIVEATVNGKPLDENATYSIATIDWLVGLYFSDVTSAKYLDTLSVDALINYIQKRKVISPVNDGRRQVE